MAMDAQTVKKVPPEGVRGRGFRGLFMASLKKI
jgi:hypothetical protein